MFYKLRTDIEFGQMPFNVHGDGLMIFLLRPINMMNYINRYSPILL